MNSLPCKRWLILTASAALLGVAPMMKTLAQVAAFGAKARQSGANSVPHMDVATRIFSNLSASGAARLCDTSLENLPASAPAPAHETWCHRVQNRFLPQPQLQET